MTDIKELALRVAKESPWYYDNEPVGDSDAIDFATRFLAAYLAEQEPVARVRVTNAAISWSAYYPTTLPIGEYDLFTAPPEPAPDEEWRVARSEALAALYGAREVLGDVANIQHAIDLLSKTEKKYKPACAAPSSEEVIALKQLWLADLEQATAELHSTPQSSSEEVREMVERLCQATPEWLPQALYAQAADLTKRLATRAEKYSELLYAVERKFPNETRHQTALRYIQQAEAPAVNSGATKTEGT